MPSASSPKGPWLTVARPDLDADLPRVEPRVAVRALVRAGAGLRAVDRVEFGARFGAAMLLSARTEGVALRGALAFLAAADAEPAD
jgi:hypothetical protein